MKGRNKEIEKSIDCYCAQLDRVDKTKSTSSQQYETLESKIASLKKEVAQLKALEIELLAHPEKQLSMADQAKKVMGFDRIDALADRSYYKGKEIQRIAKASREAFLI